MMYIPKLKKTKGPRHELTGTISRDDFGVSQGEKSAHTGSMETMSDGPLSANDPSGSRLGLPGKARPAYSPQSILNAMA